MVETKRATATRQKEKQKPPPTTPDGAVQQASRGMCNEHTCSDRAQKQQETMAAERFLILNRLSVESLKQVTTVHNQLHSTTTQKPSTHTHTHTHSLSLLPFFSSHLLIAQMYLYSIPSIFVFSPSGKGDASRSEVMVLSNTFFCLLQD